MGNGKLLIGTGLGDATVFNPQPAIAQFSNIVQQQKQQRLANQQALMEQASKINPNGIREPDRADYLDRYNDWKQSAIDANNLPQNSPQRMQALFDAQQKYGALNSFIGQSKADSEREHQISQDKIIHPYLFNDASQKMLLKSMQSPMSSSDYLAPSRYGILERGVDPEKEDAKIEALKEKALGNVNNWSTIKTEGPKGSKGGQWVQHTNSIPYDGEGGVAHMLMTQAQIDPAFQKRLADSYPSIVGQSESETNAARVHQYAIDKGYDKGWTKTTAPTQIFPDRLEQQPERWTLAQQWNLSHYGTPNPPSATLAASNQPTYTQDLASRIRNPNTINAATDELNTMAVNNPAFAHGIHQTLLPNGTTNIVIPPKYKFDTKAQKAYDLTVGQTDDNGNIIKPNPNAGRVQIQNQQVVNLDPTKPTEHDQKVAYIYNELDPKGVSGKALTPGGKGHVPTSQVQQPQGGYQHTQNAKDAKGNVITLGYKGGKWYNTKTNQPVE